MLLKKPIPETFPKQMKTPLILWLNWFLPKKNNNNQVLPVFLKVLPLKEDREESMAVFTCVSTLVLSSNQQVIV